MIVIADRFVVSAGGEGSGVGELKAAVAGLDLAKLEGMNDAGVQKQ